MESDGSGDVSTDIVRLELRDRGAGLPFSFWLVAMGGALACGLSAVAMGWQAVATQPSPCEAGAVGGLGLALAFACGSFLLGWVAWRGLRATVAFNSHPGHVSLQQDWMTIDVPGILNEPWRVHRAWMRTATTGDRSVRHGASFSVLMSAELTSVISFNQPVHVQPATAAPQIPRAMNLPPPRSWKPVTEISLDFDDPAGSVDTIRRWLAKTSKAPAPEPPGPIARHRSITTGLIVLIATGAVGFVVFMVSVPTGGAC